MASAKREMEFEANRIRYREVQSGFRFSIRAALISTGAALVCMTIYYIIRTFAMMVGSTMVMGQAFANILTGEQKTTGLEFSVDYGMWAYLAFTTGLAAAAYIFKKRWINKLLIVVFAIGGLYGIIGMVLGRVAILKGVYLFASGIFGVWLNSYVLGLHKELDHLALQEGFPDFIPALAEPKTMANTIGLTSKKSEFLLRQRKEKKENGETEASAVPDWGMDELTLDTPLPKSERKIDNMM